jgi:arsenate reductase
MIKIYHNPRCSKSREGLEVLEVLEVLEKSGKEFEIIKYLDHNLSEKEVEKIIQLLNIAPINLVRKNEKIWKENYKGKELSDKEIIIAMVENPKLIERPVVINKNKAVIARPASTILEII